MSNKSKYSQNYIQKEVIDYLEKDGALCDYYSKYYKEKETYDGGVGDRLAFKNYNDKITKYQNILKVLTGERRANVYEAMPAIDFDDPKFTSFEYTYATNQDTSTGKTTLINDEIVPIPSSAGKTSMDLLEAEDKYTINRALIGETIAEHFYNTTGLSSSSYDLQVSPYVVKDGKYEYVYGGVFAPNTFKDGIYINDIRETDLLYYPVTQATSMYFNEDTPRIVGVKKTKADGKSYVVDVLQSDSDLNSEIESTGNIVLNVDCGWTSIYDNNYQKISDYATNIKHSSSVEFKDKNIVVPVADKDSVEYQYFGHYVLNLDAGDILFAIPANAYTLNCTKLIIFKKNNTSSKEDFISYFTTAYFNPYNQRFYEDKDFHTAINPQSEKYNNKYLLPVNNVNKNNVYIYNTITTVFNKVEDVKSIDTSACTITLEKSLNPYTCYVLYIKGFNKDINSFSSSLGYDPSTFFTRVSVGDNMPNNIIESTFITKALQRYINITCNFISYASGLLTGLFSEPYSYVSSGDAETVSEWSFVNDRQTALNSGMDIEIGTKYFTGHLLNRGNILDSPLKLTSKDTYNGKGYTQLKEYGINGKATLFYKSLTSMGNIYDKILGGYKVTDNNIFFTSNNKVSRVLTSEDFINSNKLLYSKRLSNSGSAVKLENINTYINDWNRALVDIEGGKKKLVINLNSDNVRSESGIRIFNNRFLLSNQTSYSGKTLDDFYKTREELKSSAITSSSPALLAFYYRHGYTKHWRSNAEQGLTNPFELMYMSFYTPMDLFVETTGYDYDNVLIFPSEKRYFPQTVILMSSKDLGLTEKNVCFLSDNNTTKSRFIGFKVSRIVKILPSEISEIQIVGNDSFTGGEADYTVPYVDVYPIMEQYNIGTSRTDSAKTWDNYIHAGKKDNYIYYLTPIDTESLQKSINLYDANDTLIDSFSDNFNYGELYPLSYSINKEDRLFVGEKTSSSTYLINPNNREDFSKLKGFTIYPGVPNYTLSQGRDTVKWNCNISSCSAIYSVPTTSGKLRKYQSAMNFLATFAHMVDEDDNTGIVKEMLRDLISNWNMSDSTVNPIKLRDLPEVFDGLVDLGKELLDLGAEGISIQVNNRDLQINRENYKGLLTLVDENSRRIRKFKIKITSPEGIKSSDINSTNSYEAECNRLIKSQLNKVTLSLTNPDGTAWDNLDSAEYFGRLTLKEINTLFDSIFFNSNSLQSLSDLEGICKQIDNCLGNDTKAFMTIGSSAVYNGEAIDFGSAYEKLRSDIVSCISSIVYNVATTIKAEEDKEAISKVKEVYKKYYTDESIEEGVTISERSFAGGLTGKEVSVDWKKLIPRKEQKSLILQAYDKGQNASIFDRWLIRKF